MATALHKFLKKSSPFGLTSTFKRTQPLVSHANDIRKPVPTIRSSDHGSTQVANTEYVALDSFTGLVYPIFPFGVQFDSTSSIAPDEFWKDADFDSGEEDVVIRADSVKKKRKKKMNKHKYRKLRKRLRRKT